MTTARAIWAAARVMTLTFLRDRGGLAVALVMPSILFLIFSAVFSDVGGSATTLKVAVVDLAGTASTQRLAAVLAEQPNLRLADGREAMSEEAARRQLGQGTVDAAIILRSDLRAGGDADSAPILVVAAPDRAAAGSLAAGYVQRTLSERLPDVVTGRMLVVLERAGGISPEERRRLDAVLAAVADAPGGGRGPSPYNLVATERTGGSGAPVSRTAYSAGAIAVLFMMIAAVQGAAAILEERRSGIRERLTVAGPGAVDALVIGKFAMLVALGTVQAGLVFLTARAAHGVDALPHLAAWLVATVLAAAACAGLALAIATGSRTLGQAQTLGTFATLIMGAVGGSMVPRYLMPEWLRDLGRLTPNAWAVDAYGAALRGGDVLPSAAPLALFALLGLAAALALNRLS